jgi:hypothetical protein
MSEDEVRVGLDIDLARAEDRQKEAETATAQETARVAEENRQLQALSEMDDAHREEVLGELLAQDGGRHYFEDRNMMKGVLADMEPSVADAIKNARLPDGRAVLNTKKGILMLKRLGEIRRYQRENRAAYNKDASVQQEQLELLDSFIQHTNLEKRRRNYS